MIKTLMICAMLQNPEFSELQSHNLEFSEFEMKISRKRGKQNKGRRRGGNGLR